MGKLGCRVLGHAALPQHHRNQDMEFARCARCSTDLVRAAGEEEWRTVPPGHHVVWCGVESGSAAAVAARMQAPPRRRAPRSPERERVRGQQRRTRPHRKAGPGLLLGLCGRFVMAQLADALHRPARLPPPMLRLPAPRAVSRSRGQSRRA
jgi:hypothetical protein